MHINIETIPHEMQRYPTVGDYWQEGNIEQVRVSAMKDWRYEVLVTIHELIEMALTRQHGVSEGAITEFDIKFETERLEGLRFGEPGDDPDAPYRREHMFATKLERLLAAELDVDWDQYELYVDSLGFKK
ncbi:MAG: hypothetical protein JO307_15195 [Bryobacterales bacterium]|nr:hypothetical protein [Bryobacterales bacterium]MBV9399935.1 hypothetical protein [Bryobacterales bacterium]